MSYGRLNARFAELEERMEHLAQVVQESTVQLNTLVELLREMQSDAMHVS